MNSDLVRRWVGPGVGILLVAYLIGGMPWMNVVQVLAETRLRWWLPALAMGVLAVWIRSLRLHWLLGAPEPILGVWRAVALGYLAGLVLPAGGGELVKVRMLMKARGLDLIHAGSRVTLDRLLDLVGLAFGLALLGGLQALPGPVGTLLRALAGLLLLSGLLLVLFITLGKASITHLSGRPTTLPCLIWLLERMGGVLDEAEHLRRSRTWIRLLLLQVFITTFDVFTTSIALRAIPFTVALPSWAGLQVLMFSSIGFAMPLLPGGVGSLQVACIVALRPWGVPTSHALAFSLLANMGHVFLVVGHGLLALFLSPKANMNPQGELS